MRTLFALCFVLCAASDAAADVLPSCGRCSYASRPPSREATATAGGIVGALGAVGAAIVLRRRR